MSSFSSSERWDKTKKYRQDNPRAFRTALLLNAHLYRVPIENQKLQEGNNKKKLFLFIQ